MRLRNSESGYGLVTKLLHWLTVLAVAGQFVVGRTMDADDATLDREDERIDRIEELGEEQAEGRSEASEEAFENEIDGLRDELDAREDAYVSDAFSDVFSGGFLDGGCRSRAPCTAGVVDHAARHASPQLEGHHAAPELG